MKTVLYLTDFYYQANSRSYFEEDLYITSKLLPHFNLLIGHPQQAIRNLRSVDVVVFRNTGPVMRYKEYFTRFVRTVKGRGITTFNSFDGKADMKGKDYLLQLTKEGYPVIPTIESVRDLKKLGRTDRYIVKLKDGADSIGMELMNRDEIMQAKPKSKLIQPYLDLVYEVSFYFLNNRFQYALYAPDKTQRWALKEYPASDNDLQFAQTFINWNKMARGIVRVDACRLKNGSLLLMELEDLNPFLSIDVLTGEKRKKFIREFIAALKECP